MAIKCDATVVIRATNENTLSILEMQLKKQLGADDKLIVLNEPICFEDKLRQSIEQGISGGKELTIVIDADILVTSKALEYSKKIASKLDPKDLGLGLRLLDKFFATPKYRGFHIYRTEHLFEAVELIPKKGETVRPESSMKEAMRNQGYLWKNGTSRKVIGLHDYFQRPFDIYYKFLIRAVREKGGADELTQEFSKRKSDWQFQAALLGLKDAAGFDTVINDKHLYKAHFTERHANKFTQQETEKIPESIDLLLFKEFIEVNGVNRNLLTYFKG